MGRKKKIDGGRFDTPPLAMQECKGRQILNTHYRLEFGSLLDFESLYPTLDGVTFTDCGGWGTIGPIRLKDVVVDGWTCGRELLYLEGTAFEHVTFKGRIGQGVFIRGREIMQPVLRPIDDPLKVTPEECHAYLDKFYAELDWAIDVSEAELVDFTVRDFPAQLIRVNGIDQVVLSSAEFVKAFKKGAFDSLSAGAKDWAKGDAEDAERSQQTHSFTHAWQGGRWGEEAMAFIDRAKELGLSNDNCVVKH